jgi:hypothetical protein
LEEEKLPIFKSEGEAFDRAKINSEVAKGNVGALTSEVGDSMRAADKVSKEAKNFFDKVFNEELKALDPAYDPKEIAYQYAYSQSGSHKRSIERSIEKGEAVDGKEIAETAKADAKNKIANASILKSGSVTQIVENIGRSKLEQMDLFEDVKEDFDSKIQNEKFKFETLSKNLGQIISYFNDAQAGQNASNLYTVENRAILAAFAKILEGEGFNSELVKKSASFYDKHILNLVEKDKGGSVESVATSEKKDTDKNKESETKTAEQALAEKEAPKNTTGAEAKTAEQAVEPKNQETGTKTAEQAVEPKNQETGTKTAEQAVEPKTSESEVKTSEQTVAEEAPKNQEIGPKTEEQTIAEEASKNQESEVKTAEQTLAEKEEPKNNAEVVSAPTELTPAENNLTSPNNTGVSPLEGTKSETPESAKTPESESSSVQSSTDLSKSVEGNNQKENIPGSKSGADFLSSIFGISGNTKEKENKSIDGKEDSGLSSKSTLAQKIESNSTLTKFAGKLGIDKSMISSAAEKISEKISKPGETSVKNEGIKETVTQKLSSSSPKPENNVSPQEKNSSTSESSGTSSGQNETAVESSKSITEAKTENAKDDSTENGKSDDKNSELSSKMDMMVSLLAQLNDTMSGPLLITSSKKFE